MKMEVAIGLRQLKSASLNELTPIKSKRTKSVQMTSLQILECTK